MSDEIKINRVNSQNSAQSQPAPVTSSLTQDLKEAGKPSSAKTPWIILGGVIVVLIVLGVAFREKLFKTSDKGSVKGVSTKMSDSQKYQAVFLTNGQVYFGKVTSATGEYMTLQDIWYLQVVQPQQPIQGQQPAQQQAQPTISLVKLGQELHGPVDEMHISKAQILFYEDLKEDGQVVKTIMSEKAKQK